MPSRSIKHRGVAGVRFDEASFRESERRVRANQDHGIVPVRPRFDAQQFAEHRANHVQKRSIEDYRTVLETFGFRFIPDEQLIASGAFPTGSGLWRNERLQEAFSTDDILSMFPTPQEFDAWIRKKAKAAQLARAVSRGELTPEKRRHLLQKL